MAQASSRSGRASPTLSSPLVPPSFSSPSPPPGSRPLYDFARIRPSIPGVVLDHNLWNPDGDVDASLGHDVPISLLRQRAFRSAIGAGPPLVLPAQPTAATGLTDGGVGAHARQGQYAGKVSIVSWNTQALFCSDPGRHRARTAKICGMMTNHDVGCWSEAHGTMDRCQAWRNPIGCTPWWSPGPSTASAGVGITVRNSFLQLFDGVKFDVVFPGRAAVLRLSGIHGCLDVFTVYLPTGDSARPDDLREAGYGAAERRATNFELRDAVRCRVASQVRARYGTMTVIAGDFNYVTRTNDRVCTTAATPTGTRDYREESRWRTLLGPQHGMHELFQPEMTYAPPPP